MKGKPLLLTANLLLIPLLTGCMGRGNGGGFDIVKFLQNPIVMIVLAILIVYWMMKRSK